MALTKVTGSGIQGITIDSNSRIIMSSQPRWFVGKTGNAQDAINPVVFDAVGVNNGSHYSTSTGKFTAPVAGDYFASFRILSKAGSVGSGAEAQIRINKNGTTVAHSYQYGNTAGTDYSGQHFSLNTFVVVTLAANDELTCQTDYQGFYGAGYTAFSGHLLG